MLQRNTSVSMALMPCSYPVEVTTSIQKHADSTKKGVFAVERCIEYSVGKRHLSLKITEIYNSECVNLVYIELAEESSKGSCANLNLRFIRNDFYGVLSSMQTELSGSYKLIKQNYCVPPLPEAELAFYSCRQTGDGSCFTLEKKRGDRNNSDFVERVKCTHAFVVGEETMIVKVKITNDARVGLRVEVDDPLKLTTDYSRRVLTKIEEKMESEMMAHVLSLFKNVIGAPQIPANDRDPDTDRTVFRHEIRSYEPKSYKAYIAAPRELVEK